MKLPGTLDGITAKRFDSQKLHELIRERRTAIRAHRDARGDDRCWLDDYNVWSFLEDSQPDPTHRMRLEIFMGLCRAFHSNRSSLTADPIPTNAIRNPQQWDSDLAAADDKWLTMKLYLLQNAILVHRDKRGRRACEDDRLLYSVLPEKLPADFRLPPEEEFLGEAKAPTAGCPSFWRSHGACSTQQHNLHVWGPCSRIPSTA